MPAQNGDLEMVLLWDIRQRSREQRRQKRRSSDTHGQNPYFLTRAALPEGNFKRVSIEQRYQRQRNRESQGCPPQLAQ